MSEENVNRDFMMLLQWTLYWPVIEPGEFELISNNTAGYT